MFSSTSVPVQVVKRIGMIDQFARDQGEQVGRLGPGVAPFRPTLAAVLGVAVGQQDRMRAFDAYGEDRHNVGPVGIVGDLAETLGLALGAVHAVRHVETFQRGIGFRADLDLALPDEGLVGYGAGEPLWRHLRIDRLAVDARRDELELFAMQEEPLVGGIGVRCELDAAQDPGAGGGQPEGQVHIFDQKPEGRVVGQIDRLGGGIFHLGSLLFGRLALSWEPRLGSEC